MKALNDELVGVVREAMQPAYVSLWTRPDTASEKDVDAMETIKSWIEALGSRGVPTS